MARGPQGRQIAEYYIFLASPGDMSTERDAVREFFTQYTTTTALPRNHHFTVLDWEHFADTGVGRPQELITTKTLEKYGDHLVLVIGLMGQRFGSPSGTHESGTEEEFEWALEKFRERGFPEVKWFFRKVENFTVPSTDPAEIQAALAQWEKVQNFKQRLQHGESQLFYKEFTELNDFRNVLRRDLELWLNAEERPWTEARKSKRKRSASTRPSSSSARSTGQQAGRATKAQREALWKRYLEHVISRNCYLQLQGLRSGGRVVNIELDQIYITLKATRTRTREAEEAWLVEEHQLAPGELQKRQREVRTETVTVKVEEALAEHKHLVVLGDPGSGKTTLLRYLALLYARDCAEGSTLIRDRLGLPESAFLPLLLPLRNIGAYLKAQHPKDDGTEGHGRLLTFLQASLRGERIDIPDDFFDAQLKTGHIVVLFDGMDEVGDFKLRCRVARLIEKFAQAYPDCRTVVTSRIVGYTGAARLGEGFATTTIQDFTLADVAQFLTHWHQQIAEGQMGPGESAKNFAATQTEQLLDAVRNNPRVRELAINPLMLTVIALVHRDRVKLPERRAELYAEAADVLLGKWDEARRVEDSPILENGPFDLGDRRHLLRAIAFTMHTTGQKAIEVDALQKQVQVTFRTITPNERAAERATARFLEIAKERTGLLVEAGVGIYRFSHLTFQEYLAAVEQAEQADYLPATLQHTADPFWRELILLEAGYLSTTSRTKTTQLIRAIADSSEEPEPFHNLVLAAECIRDVGPTRIEEDLTTELVQRLHAELEKPLGAEEETPAARQGKRRRVSKEDRKAMALRRVAAATALSRIETGSFGSPSQYWSLPYGEPEWVTVPAGEFWMGSDQKDKDAQDWEKPISRIFIPEFRIAQTPVTNAQYQLYIQATESEPPTNWEDGQPPKNKLTHPVVSVSWYTACSYCEWLSKVTGKHIRLPTEAEWEKAARGDTDPRIYPWGDESDALKCNTGELGLEDTSPVGIFLAGASPYGCLDMAGNVWEWTCSLWGKDVEKPDFTYPYQPADGREDLDASGEIYRVLRGGGFFHALRGDARCASRGRNAPVVAFDFWGFRVIVLPNSGL